MRVLKGLSAIHLRRLSLFFLRIRALRQNKHNIRIVVGEQDDPHLASAEADSVLIANTYRELTDRRSILGHILRSLRPGGRLVVVIGDRQQMKPLP
jgi:ubiquinone/menaquinone biosynthesis C-methylase UbiE